MRKIEYVLVKVVEPLILGGVKLVSDRKAFGIELTYEINYYKKIVKIGKFVIFKPFPYKSEKRTYLRPLKVKWSAERGRLPKNHWGTKTHPLCGVDFWWEIKRDRGYRSSPKLIEQIKDHALIKRLRAATIKDEKRLKELDFDPKKFHFINNNQKSNQNE